MLQVLREQPVRRDEPELWGHSTVQWQRDAEVRGPPGRPEQRDAGGREHRELQARQDAEVREHRDVQEVWGR